MAAESPAAAHLPFVTKPIRLGGQGVNLAKAGNGLDSLAADELARMTNVLTGQGAGVQIRPGATRLQTLAGVNVHSASRLYAPDSGGVTHFYGMDGSWIRAEGAGVTVLEAGFSGDPMTMVPWATELGGLFKMYVADKNKMRRAGFASASQQIGLPKPPQPTSVVAEASGKKVVASFSAADGSDFTKWSPSGGPDINFDGVTHLGVSGVPILSAIAGPDGNGVNMAAVVNSATASYSFWMNLQRNLDLTTFGGGVASTVDDVIHIQIRMDNPAAASEIRVYFIVSPFDPSAVPGTAGTKNTSAYVRSYRPSDYTGFVAGSESADQSADQVRTAALLNGYTDPTVTDATVSSTAGLPGANTFTEYGKIGLPIRKSDFFKIGTAGQAGTDWSTITGLCIRVQTTGAIPINIAFDQLWLLGGANVDTSEIDAQPLDYRITNYDTLTGARSNPSDVMTTTIDVMRQKVDIQPVAYGQVGVIQEAYRRGGNLVDNWYFVAKNAVDGGLIVDNSTEEAALAAGAVQIDHDQPITSIDSNGNAVYNQPVPVLFGPISGYLFACGDPNRPGFLYWSKRNEPDHWPSTNTEAVCPPEDELQNGGEYGGGAFVFSRQRLYTIQVNLVDGSISTNPTDCAEGLFARYGMAIGAGGLFFVARDAVRVTQGAGSVILSDNIRPLFEGTAIEGYFPIDFTQPKKMRLVLHGDDLWFGFQDTNGGRPWWVYSLTYKTWRCVTFAMAGGVGMVYSDPTTVTGKRLILGGATSGNAYTHDGLTDDGVAFTWELRTGAESFGAAREEKTLGDLAVWGNVYGTTLTATVYLNNETVVDAPFAVVGSAIEDRYIFDIFGTTPQHAQTVSVNLAGTSSGAGVVYITRLGMGVAVQPEVTMNRVTTWEPLNNGNGEAYLMGCSIDSDTFGTPRTIFVEGLLGGTLIAVATLTVNSNAGRRQWFSWPAAHVDMIRLRPSDNCVPWMLFGCTWLAAPEPPRIAVWDSNLENLGDSYYTGLDLECNTFNKVKTLVITVDGVQIGPVVNVQTNGRKVFHITLPAGRGHIYQFVATDANVGLLYTHKWIVAAEPGEQTNWNQNYTTAGSLADKWLKGILVECDTFGQNKTVTVECDGNVIATVNVNTNGRKVQHLAFPQALGRVFRIYPTDTNPGRLYSLGWLFDEEPYQLTRYETQEQPDGMMGFHVPCAGQIAIKSTAAVTMLVTAYGQNGAILSAQNYNLPSTGGVKSMISLNTVLQAQKGLLFKFVFTSANGFWLYREESWIQIQPLMGGATTNAKVFGDDDLDQPRPMRDASLMAARSGGGGVG